MKPSFRGIFWIAALIALLAFWLAVVVAAWWVGAAPPSTETNLALTAVGGLLIAAWQRECGRWF